MKLHLPIALLAAVLSTVAYGGQPYESSSFNEVNGVFTYEDNGVKYTYSSSDDGTVTSSVTGDAKNVSFYKTWNGDTMFPGTIVNVPYTHTGWTASNTVLNIGDGSTETKIDMVFGAGVKGTKVLGDKIINIREGASVGDVYAGYFAFDNYGKYPSYPGYAEGQADDNKLGASNADSQIVLNVEGNVGAIWGHYVNGQGIINLEGASMNESITINILGGQVGDIHGGGNNGIVDNNISIIVKDAEGRTASTGSIYAGGITQNANFKASVESTHVTINSGTVNGDIFGGGEYNPHSSYGGTEGRSEVKGNTLVEINGGIVNGNVYGGGEADIIGGNTHVLLRGGEITGDVYGSGDDQVVGSFNAVSEVGGEVKVTIAGEGTKVGGTIFATDEKAIVGTVVGTDKRILAFDNYTANTGADGYAQVKWTKADGTQQYQNFNALEVNKGKVDLGDISSAFETLKLTSTDVKASSLQGEQIQLNMTTSSFKVDGELNMAEGSKVAGYPWSELSPVLPDELCDITATEINGNGVEIQGTHLTATEGNISISDSKLDVVHFKAVNGTVSLKNIENIPGRGDGKTVTGVTVDAKGLNLDNTKLSYKVTGSPKVSLDNLQLNNASEFTVATGAEIGTVWASGENNKFVQGGEGGDVKIDQIFLAQIGESDGTVVNSDLTIEQQSGVTGNMSIGHIVGDGSTSGEGASVKIEQKGKGSIDFNGWVMGAPVSVSQTGGGTVTVNKSAHVALQTLNVTNGSTFENLGSVSLEEVAVSYAALLNGATLTVTDVLKLEGANIGVIADTFVETGSAIMLGQGAQITGLDSATFSIVFAENAVCDEYTLSDMLADPTLNGEFQVDIIGGLDTTLAQEIAAAFTKDMLTLQATDANGNLVDMIVWDAQMTNVNGTLTISGSASVPEPTTATLSLLALAALAARRRRR